MSSTRWLVLLPFVASALALVHAQTSPGQKQNSAAPDFSKEAYVIERFYTRVNAESDGTGSRELTAEVKMLADAGVKAFAVLSFTYTSANEVVDIDYVRVRKPDGTLVKTPDYNIQDMPGEVTRTAPLYSDIHEKHVAVKGLAVGDVLEYLVRFRVVKPEVAGHFWYEYEFTKRAIVRDEQLELNVPKDKYVKVVSPSFKPDTREDGNRRVYRWTHQNLIVEQADPDEIPRRIPPNPDVQVTTFASWEEVGRWYAGLQKDSLAVTPAIQAKAAELTKGLKSDDEKIHAIYNFVSLKYHYIGLDFGIGRYQPHPADDVLDNGYGDCKDKQTLLASLLKASGIDAWPVLIHATRKLDPDVPSPAQFNHVIGVVPEGDKLVWLDTTPEVAPFGLLMLTLRGKQALVIPTNEPPKLATTPDNPPQPQRQEFSMSGKLNTDAVFTGHAEQIYEGDVEVALRAAFRQVSESQWKELVQRISRRLNFAGDVSGVKVSAPDEIDQPLLISYDYERKNFGDFENHHTIAPLPPMGIEFTRDSKDRKPPEPVLLGSVGKVTYRARVELPAGYKVFPQSPVHLAESFADYDSRTIVDGQLMTITRVLTIKKREVPLSDWEAFRKFGQGVNDDESNFIVLGGSGTGVPRKKDSEKESAEAKDKGDTVKAEKLDPADAAKVFHDGEYALQQRDFQKAQELFEKVIAADPNYKGAHFDLGIALGARNNFSDAIEQFHEEERVSPEDLRSYQVVAMFRTRTNKPDEAIQEWRKLLKVDPENLTAASALAGLLYQAGKYPEAVDVLETAVKTAPDSSSLQMQLGASYIKIGQNEKAIVSFRRVVDQKGDDPGILNEVAYTLAENKLQLDLAQRYAEKAVKELETESVTAAAEADTNARVVYQLSLTWDTLGWIYFLNGDASRSESYVRAAWLLGQAAEVGEHLGEIYEKEGKKKAAAHTYELALVAAGEAQIYLGGPVPSPAAPNGSGSVANEITSRYQKLTGSKPSIRESNRLPNGEWTKSAVEQFSEMRTVKFGKQPNLSGSAVFSIVFAPGKIETVDYQSGEQSLKALTERIKAAQYQVEFPPLSEARIRRQGLANCSSISGCMVVLVPPAPPRSLPNYLPSY